jgi:hypothetical protein
MASPFPAEEPDDGPMPEIPPAWSVHRADDVAQLVGLVVYAVSTAAIKSIEHVSTRLMRRLTRIGLR